MLNIIESGLVHMIIMAINSILNNQVHNMNIICSGPELGFAWLCIVLMAPAIEIFAHIGILIAQR